MSVFLSIWILVMGSSPREPSLALAFAPCMLRPKRAWAERIHGQSPRCRRHFLQIARPGGARFLVCQAFAPAGDAASWCQPASGTDAARRLHDLGAVSRR